MMKMKNKYLKLQKEIDKIVVKYEKEVARNFAKGMKKLNNEIAKLYRKYGIDGQLTFEDMNKYNRYDRLEDYIIETVREVYKTNDKIVRAGLIHASTKAVKGNINIITSAKDLKGVKWDYDVRKIVNENMGGLNWAKRAKFNRVETIHKLEQKVGQGLEQGWAYDKLSRELSQELNVSLNKATTMVRTETHRCVSTVNQESYEKVIEAGFEAEKVWISSRDERVRSAHSELDGVAVGVDENFVSPAGGEGLGPGMMNNPSDDINCRCTTMIRFK